MTVKLLTEHHLEFLSLKEGCRGSSESTHVKMPHCWKSSVTAQIPFSWGRRKFIMHVYSMSWCSSLFFCHLAPALMLPSWLFGWKYNESLLCSSLVFCHLAPALMLTSWLFGWKYNVGRSIRIGVPGSLIIESVIEMLPFNLNGICHSYQLNQSISILRVPVWNLSSVFKY